MNVSERIAHAGKTVSGCPVCEYKQQRDDALKYVQELCSDCLMPFFSESICPSCHKQILKELLGHKPRLSRGETE